MAQNQAYLFLVFSITGIFIGILFDIFRIIRKNIKTPNFITNLQDILFWILTGILILYTIWFFNNGELRIFIFLSLIMGVLIYIFLLSDIIVKILNVFIKILKQPFFVIFKFLQKFFTKLNKKVKNIAKKIRIKRGKFAKNGE